MSTNYRYSYTDINYYQYTMITEIAPTIIRYIFTNYLDLAILCIRVQLYFTTKMKCYGALLKLGRAAAP